MRRLCFGVVIEVSEIVLHQLFFPLGFSLSTYGRPAPTPARVRVRVLPQPLRAAGKSARPLPIARHFCDVTLCTTQPNGCTLTRVWPAKGQKRRCGVVVVPILFVPLSSLSLARVCLSVHHCVPPALL